MKNLKAKIGAILGSVAIVAGMSTALAAPAQAAPPCRGTWTIGIGGLGNNDSSVFPTVHQRVGYNSVDTRNGVNELNRLIRDHRNQCPGDFIKAIGHSGGAAALHVWVSENGNIGRMSVVLLADPKRAPGPGGPGFAQTDFPFNLYPPLAGADANFRGVPVLTICNAGDHICNSQAGWEGYAFQGTHAAYDFDVNHYANNASGVVFR